MGILSCAFPCCLGSVRYMVTFLCFLAVIISNSQRSVLNIAIVEMVSSRKMKNGSTCPPVGSKSSVIQDIGGGKVDWSQQDQQMIISGFFPLYFFFHVPFGILCDKYGARHFLLWCTVISSVVTMLIPVLAIYTEWWAVCAIRVFFGAVQAVYLPAISSVISRWIPPQERATVGAMVFAANSFGILTGSLITGLLIRVLTDWRFPFYMWGVVGLIYSLLLAGYVFSDPRLSPFITEVELNYLKELMIFKEPMKQKFWAIITDVCIWGLVAAQCGHGFIIFTLQNNLPKYLNNVLGFDIVANSLTSLLFILQWVSGLLSGMLSDYLCKDRNANVEWMRKSYTAISNIGSAIFLLAAGLAECNWPLVLVFLAIAIFVKGFFFAGMKVNIIDVSINHSGLVMAVINGIGSLPGFLSAFLISLVAPNNTHQEWFWVFMACLILEVVTSILYCAMSSTERRKWDYKEGETPPEKKKANHWYLQMTPSDDDLRKEKIRKAKENNKVEREAAMAKMKADYKAALAARRNRN